jgi:hypothetical protein
MIYTTKSAPKRKPRGPLKLNLPEPDSSLWFRYYQAGEDASITRHDQALAKRYWLAALSEIEKKPPSRSDIFLSIKLSALEQGLEDLYPKDWSKEKGDPEKVMKLQAEQVDTLARIAHVNNNIVPHGDLLYTKSEERYQQARADYEKALKDSQKQTDPKPVTQ